MRTTIGRRSMLGIVGTLALLVAVIALVVTRSGRQHDMGDTPVQIPFDHEELRDLMDRVVDNQREIVAQLDNDAAARQRALGFLRYYERRRAAVDA